MCHDTPLIRRATIVLSGLIVATNCDCEPIVGEVVDAGDGVVGVGVVVDGRGEDVVTVEGDRVVDVPSGVVAVERSVLDVVASVVMVGVVPVALPLRGDPSNGVADTRVASDG